MEKYDLCDPDEALPDLCSSSPETPAHSGALSVAHHAFLEHILSGPSVFASVFFQLNQEGKA